MPTLEASSVYIANAPLPESGFTIISPINSFGILINFAIGENTNSNSSIPLPDLNTPIARNIPIMYGAIDQADFNPSIAPFIKLSYISIFLYLPYTIIYKII